MTLKRFKIARETLRAYRRGEDGGMTLWSLFMFLAMLLIGGFAIDATNATRAHTQLQMAADAAGHAALYWLERTHDETQAKAKAIEIAQRNMPTSRFGDVLKAEDIEFGTWDRTAKTFTPMIGSESAVRVNTRRIAARDNSVSTFLLKLVGIWEIDINTPSVWETYNRGCLREGFVAQGMVDLQSGNTYKDGFCVHSNTMVSVNSNNYFEDGTIVSIPNGNALDLPRSGFVTNDGLQEALQIGPHLLRVFNQLVQPNGAPGELLMDLVTPSSAQMPAYIDPNKVDSLGNPIHQPNLPGNNNKSAQNSDFVPNMVNFVRCNSSKGKLTLQDPIENIVLWTNCSVEFANGAALQNARLVVTNTDEKSVSSPSSMRIGLNDSCADGGDAQIVTLGGVDFASGLEAFGAQILAMKDIEFSANASGIEGAAFTSLGEIHGTSNMSFGFCGTGVPNLIEVDYFRMVM